MEKYGLLAKIIAQPETRSDLSDILQKASKMMKDAAGNIRYDVHHEKENDDVIWVTEIWESEEMHDNSLSMPGVGELIGKAQPMIADFEVIKLSTQTS